MQDKSHRLLGDSDEELLSAGLLVMHAHAADPLQAYGELFKSAPLPPLMRQGIMEPAILKHYLLLHDDAAVPGGLARSALHHGQNWLFTRDQNCRVRPSIWRFCALCFVLCALCFVLCALCFVLWLSLCAPCLS